MEKTKTERLQWILDDAVARGEIPGATLLVRKDGKEEVYLESGYADIEAKKPVARDSIYRLYSMSKPITAVAVMLLAERGQIDLADPVCRYLPGFCGQLVAYADGRVEKPWRDVNIQDLLNMTSGLVYEGNHPAGRQTEALFEEITQRLDEGEAAADTAPWRSPTGWDGSRWHFSRSVPGVTELRRMWPEQSLRWYPVCVLEISWKKSCLLRWRCVIPVSGYRKRKRIAW